MANLSFFETANSVWFIWRALAHHVLPTLEDACNEQAYSANSAAVVTILHKRGVALYNVIRLARIIVEPLRLNV
jgi:hypothetical protein